MPPLFWVMLSLTMTSVNDTAEAPVENDSPSGPSLFTLSLALLAAFSSSKRMIDCPNEELKATKSKNTDRKQDFIFWLLACNSDGYRIGTAIRHRNLQRHVVRSEEHTSELQSPM